jgi:outer membrane protein assembly factor BamB
MRIAFAALVAALVATGAAWADWPQWRGPDGSGVSNEKGLPLKWSATENVVWKAALPGPGSSSPVVVGGKIYLTCYTGYGLSKDNPGNLQDLRLHVLCVDGASGKILWDKDTRMGPVQRYGGFAALHGYASSTPAADERAVYVFLGATGVFALDHSGKPLWKQQVGRNTHGWGSGASPVLVGDVLVVNASVESGSLYGLDKKTGRVLWKQGGMTMAWDTPAAVKANDRTEVVISVRGQVKAFDPETGRPLWTASGINDYICPSIVSHEGVVYSIGGRKNTALAIKAGGSGNVSGTHTVWEINKGSNVSSPVYWQGNLYWAHESRGVVYGVNAANGEVLYEQRLQPRPGIIYSSPLLSDGRVYYVSRENGTYVVDAGAQYEQLARNVIQGDGSPFNASPAPLKGGRLLLRSDKALYCLGSK